MQSATLKFYGGEKLHHNGTLAYEWLLEEVNKLGVPVDSTLRAVACFG